MKRLLKGIVTGTALMGFVMLQSVNAKSVTRAEFEALQQELMSLKQLVHEQKSIIDTYEGTAPTQANSGLNTSDWLEVDGLVEIEAAHTRAENGADSSDLVVATLEIGATATFTDWVSAELVFLYEEDDTEFDVDTATVTIAPFKDNSSYFTVGTMIVPFGNFDSAFVTDPIALDLGETAETAFLIGADFEGISLSAGAFNGGLTLQGDDQIETYFAAASIATEIDDVRIHGGLSWISNVAESDALEEFANGNSWTMDDTIRAYNLWATISFCDMTLIGEYVALQDDLAPIGTSNGQQPKAYNLELAYEVSKTLEVGAKYEATDDVAVLGLANERAGIVANWLFYENEFAAATSSLELLSEEFASGNNQDTIKLLMAVEF